MIETTNYLFVNVTFFRFPLRMRVRRSVGVVHLAGLRQLRTEPRRVRGCVAQCAASLTQIAD